MVLFTGFPGFLGSELLPRALQRDAGGREAVCLVQPKFAAMARARLDEIVARHRLPEGSVRIVEGDITRPDLALGAEQGPLLDRVTHVYHLAAVYDLEVGRDTAMRVNVEGTRNLLAFARACRKLERFQYVSTCYVSGRHGGVFTEAQLVEGQSFNNSYEESKYLAEVLVREHIASALPATIFRPAIVVGHSRTGATQKYDGPYHTIRWLLWQPRVTILPLPIGAGSTPLNLVPWDFVVDAIDYLGTLESSIGVTYQLADPRALTLAEVIGTIATLAGCRVLTVPVPFGLARATLAVPGVARFAPVTRAMLDYTVRPAVYDTSATTAALEGSGIACPSFTDYAACLVEFVRAHPEVGSAAMV